MYFVFLVVLAAGFVMLELNFPGSWNLQFGQNSADLLGTTEYSLLETSQILLLFISILIVSRVLLQVRSQRVLALLFIAIGCAMLIRELDYFLDRLVADNFWQMLIGVLAAVTIVYVFRQKKWLKIALYRLWPSPALTMLFTGFTLLLSFAQFIGHEALWLSILGDDYRRVVKLAAEEYIELLAYALLFIGSVEYLVESREMQKREPPERLRPRRSMRKSP